MAEEGEESAEGQWGVRVRRREKRKSTGKVREGKGGQRGRVQEGDNGALAQEWQERLTGVREGDEEVGRSTLSADAGFGHRGTSDWFGDQ